MSVERKKILEVSRKLTMEEAEKLAFLGDLSKDFEPRTPFKVLEKMYEMGLTEEDLVDSLKEIERKDLVALVQKKPKPKNRSKNGANAAGSEALSSLLATTAFNLAQVSKCLELDALLSERDFSTIRKIDEESRRIKQCVQDRLQWSSSKSRSNSESSGDEKASTQPTKIPMLPPKNRPRYGVPKECTETDHAQPHHRRETAGNTPSKQHPDSGFYDSARFSSGSFKLPDPLPPSPPQAVLKPHKKANSVG